MDQIKLLMSSIPVVDDTCLLHCVGWSLLFGFMHLSLPVYFNNFQHEWWSGLKGSQSDLIHLLVTVLPLVTSFSCILECFCRKETERYRGRSLWYGAPCNSRGYRI